MTDKPNDLLLLAAKILTFLMQGILAFAVVVMLIALPAILIFQGDINAQIVTELGEDVGPLPLLLVAGLIACVVGVLTFAWLFFGKLRAIISTVGKGDPFAPENADRLTLMGWLMLGCQVLLIPAAGLALMLAKWAEPMEHFDVTIDAGLDIEGILLVLILFILARVFKHGAAMREDLEGTV